MVLGKFKINKLYSWVLKSAYKLYVAFEKSLTKAMERLTLKYEVGLFMQASYSAVNLSVLDLEDPLYYM